MTNQKEYTTIMSPDDDKKKRRVVSFKILSGVAATIALSSGGYHLLHSNNNSPQSVSMTSMNVLRSNSNHKKHKQCERDRDCGLHLTCKDKKCQKCKHKGGCGGIDTHGCQTDAGKYWCESKQECLRECDDDTVMQ
eukprot:CAMPEP_0170874424 /NCGR_PEP_ID=MMETSP0734-20130129/28139_1 /TAXON_ID=186038 /ORGANISM="Fragilariopsis kerguelensis, Strain L26-C5" /LENGTH=135 /DNA_ID=CAMNT_0011255369 /DNA_START=70 /DNA_END=477 /DNA_ORIENTATION=-